MNEATKIIILVIGCPLSIIILSGFITLFDKLIKRIVEPNVYVDPCRVISAMKFQKENGYWDLYQEREFIENLFCTRFNFFLVAVGFLIGAALSIHSQLFFKIIMGAGFVITLLLSLAIFRIYHKLIIILKMLYKLESNSVFCVIYEHIQKERNPTFKYLSVGVNQIIGVYIPFLLTLFFFVGFILACLGILNVDTAL